MGNYKTEQEKFWAEEFGDEYINRNQSSNLLASNISFFSKALHKAGSINSLIEFGANVGMNLRAIRNLYPNLLLKGIEINKKAAEELSETIGRNNVIHNSLLELNSNEKFDVTLIKGVLIHIAPDKLDIVYKNLYEMSNKYILIAEYYNPTPVEINYRGHSNKLFKRDFAGEFLLKYPQSELLDYGFVYKNDPQFPQDDITWFLIRK